MGRAIMCEHDRKVNAKLSQIKSNIKALKKLGYRVEIEKDVETMYGAVVDHIYLVSRLMGRVCFQKLIVTADKR